MLADAVAAICGDAADVEPIMGQGTDPHYYKASASDLGLINSGDLLVTNGLELEGRMADILEGLGDKTIAAATTIDQSEVMSVEHGVAHDPHIWHDANLWASLVRGLGQALADRYPEHKDQFLKNAAAYADKLVALDAETKELLSTIPEKQRVMVTAHDAFRYFGRRYNVEVLGIQGTNTTAEASAQRIKELAEIIVDRKIKSVFVETSVPPGTVEALIKAVESRGWNIDMGGSLFSDAMGAPGTPEGTYSGMFRHNTKTIYEALK